MKLVLLLATTMAAAVLPSLGAAHWNHGPDPNAIYRQGSPRDVAGPTGFPDGGGGDSYGRTAANAAAAAAAEGEGRLVQYHHRHYRRQHHRYRGTDCNVRFIPVQSLMGTAATRCAECLTATAIAAGGNTTNNNHNNNHNNNNDYSSSSMYFGARSNAACRDECHYVLRGSEFFVPLPTYPLNTSCLPGKTCYQGDSSTTACRCCGQNLGMNYTMPPASPTDFLGEVSNFRRSCDLPVSANDCLACLLWRKLRGSYYYKGSSQTSLPCTQSQQCFKTKDHIHTLMGTAIVDDPYHYLLLPGSSQADWPVIGIEDPQVLTPRLERIWDLAWKLAFKPYSQLPFTAPFSVPDLPVANHSCRIGIALNPASARSQHQMHIHIARIPTPLRQLFVGREENFGAWTKVRIPITRQTSASPIAYVRYFSLLGDHHRHRHRNDNDNDKGDFNGQAAGGAAFGYGNNNDAGTAAGTFSGTRPSDYHIFRQAFHFARRSFLRLQAWGILIIPDEEPIYLRDKHASLPRGFYLVLSTNNVYGTWNSYSVTAVNANYQPELLLCTTYSTGDEASFWRPDECFADMLARTDTAPGLTAALRAGAGRRYTDGFAAQQVAQDGSEVSSSSSSSNPPPPSSTIPIWDVTGGSGTAQHQHPTVAATAVGNGAGNGYGNGNGVGMGAGTGGGSSYSAPGGASPTLPGGY